MFFVIFPSPSVPPPGHVRFLPNSFHSPDILSDAVVSILKESLNIPQKYLSQAMTVFVGFSSPSVIPLIILLPLPLSPPPDRDSFFSLFFCYGLSLDTDKSPKIPGN
jgi:hypothetical protein